MHAYIRIFKTLPDSSPHDFDRRWSIYMMYIYKWKQIPGIEIYVVNTRSITK